MASSGLSALLTDRAWADADIEQEVLAAGGIQLVEAPAGASREQLLECADGVAAIMTCWQPVDRDLIERSERLTVVTRMGVGLDNINLEAAAERGVVVTNVPDYCVEEVSDHVLAFVHAWARGIVFYDRDIHAGRWAPGSRTLRRVSDLTVGIIGLGRIGQRVAHKLRLLGCRVLGLDRHAGRAPDAVELVGRETLLALSDVITLHVPLSPGTRHLVDAEFLTGMRPGALLVNASRGEVVDNTAIVRALRTSLGGAALDVLEEEPQVPPALLDLPNVVLTPHVAFSSDMSVRELRQRSAEDVVRVLRGEAPRHPVALPPTRGR